MNSILEHALTVFMAFFAIMNPISNTAVFAGLTEKMGQQEQTQVAIKALTISFFIILLFCMLGKSIFHLFAITLPALRIAGGILVFIIGYHMLQGKNSSLHTGQESTGSDISVSPLAVPILAGPGTIATVMNYSVTGSWTEILITMTVVLAMSFITFLCFIYSSKIQAIIGEGGLAIVTRLMGLILTVIGVQMLIVGVTSIYHGM